MKKLIIVLIIGMLVMTGCDQLPGTAQSCRGEANAPGCEETGLPPVQQAKDFIHAEAVIEPARWITLRSGTTGKVEELAIAEGDHVQAGDVLLHIDAPDVDLGIQEAEAALKAAEAQLALVKAGTRPEQIAMLEAQLATASATISRTLALRGQQLAGGTQVAIAEVQTRIVEADVVQQQADEAHDKTMECFDIKKPDGTEETLCPTLGTYEEVARAQLEAAQTALAAAQTQLAAVQGSAYAQDQEAEASVQTAIAQRDVVQAELALAQAGSRTEAIAAAEAAVHQAELALASARAAREEATLTAPFEGTVTELAIDIGDTVMVGDPLFTLASLDEYQVRTKDLTELDVVDVAPGQSVSIKLEAMPDQPLAGQVIRVDRRGTDYLGDVSYPVIITPNDAPSWLRWGMTAEVEILSTASSAPHDARSAIHTSQSVLGGSEYEDLTTSNDHIIAEALVEPARWRELRFMQGGEVFSVSVEAGDHVMEGDNLVVLDSTHADLAVQAAEAAIATAQAQLRLKQAGVTPETLNVAEAKLAAAESALAQAVAAAQQLTTGGTEAEIAAAQAQQDAAQAEKRQLQAALQWAEDDDDEDKAEDLRDHLRVVDARITAAQTQMAALPRIAAARQRAADANVLAAEAQLAATKAQIALLKAGATPEEITIARADVQQAEVALATAKVALARTTLIAPFAGTITEVYVERGDRIAPGQPILVLADLDRQQVTTLDLLELDVVHVHSGQHAVVRVDALPGEAFQGRVAQVDLQSVPYRGDVTYPVTIQLDATSDSLLWGMTAVVEIGE